MKLKIVFLLTLVGLLLACPSSAAQPKPQPKVPAEVTSGELQKYFNELEWRLQVVKMQHDHLKLSAENLAQALAKNFAPKALVWAVGQLSNDLGVFDIGAQSVTSRCNEVQSFIRDEKVGISLPERVQFSRKVIGYMESIQAMNDDLPDMQVSLSQAQKVLREKMPAHSIPKAPEPARSDHLHKAS